MLLLINNEIGLVALMFLGLLLVYKYKRKEDAEKEE